MDKGLNFEMLKNLFLSKKSNSERTPLKNPEGALRQDSSTRADSVQLSISKQELLNQNGRLICKVLFQVMRRSCIDSTGYHFLVEFENPKTQTFRVMANIPPDAALSHLQCKEFEHTAIIELDMRHGIRLTSMFWRIKDTDDSSVLLSGFTPLADLGLGVGSPAAPAKKAFPPPVRIKRLPSAEEGLFVSTDREATVSELMEFQVLLRPPAVSSETFDPSGTAQNQN